MRGEEVVVWRLMIIVFIDKIICICGDQTFLVYSIGPSGEPGAEINNSHCRVTSVAISLRGKSFDYFEHYRSQGLSGDYKLIWFDSILPRTEQLARNRYFEDKESSSNFRLNK